MLATFWFALYNLMEAIYSASFVQAGAPTTARVPRAALFYFSLITLTTVGYGDVVPVTPAAPNLCSPGGSSRCTVHSNYGGTSRRCLSECRKRMTTPSTCRAPGVRGRGSPRSIQWLILFGLTTAFLFTVIQRAWPQTYMERPRGA